MWLLTDDHKLAMSCIPKNGSTSMRNSIPANKIFTNDEVLHIPIRVAWIREPVNRLISCYSFFYYLNQRDQNGRKEPSIKVTSSWESFVDYALIHPNPHWNPQKPMLTLDDVYIPTITHRFEDIMKLWGNYIPGLLPWQNACTKLPVNAYREDEIKQFYEEDSKLWHGL